MIGAVDVLFVDEAGQISLANVIATSTRDAQHRAARRPAAARSADAGCPSAGCGPLGARPRARRRGHDRRDRGLFLETTWRLHPALCDFISEVFYDGRLEPQPHLAAQRLIVPTELIDGVGRGSWRSLASGADNESPVEAARSPRSPTTLVRDGSLDRFGARHEASDLGGRAHRRAVQRPGRGDQTAPAAGGSGGHRGQVPGSGGADQPLFDDDLEPRAGAAGDGLPVQPQPPERGDIAGPVRRRRRRVARPAARPGSDARADAARECVLPLRGARVEHRPTSPARPAPRMELLTLGLA